MCDLLQKFKKSIFQPIPVAVLSKAWLCGRSLAGIAASNPAGCVGISWKCFLLSGRGLCDGPIPRPEDFYRVWCVIKRHKSFTLTVSRYIEVKTEKEEERKKELNQLMFIGPCIILIVE